MLGVVVQGAADDALAAVAVPVPAGLTPRLATVLGAALNAPPRGRSLNGLALRPLEPPQLLRQFAVAGPPLYGLALGGDGFLRPAPWYSAAASQCSTAASWRPPSAAAFSNSVTARPSRAFQPHPPADVVAPRTHSG